jgi:cholesterol oxidase
VWEYFACTPKSAFKSGSWSELEDWETELKPFYKSAHYAWHQIQVIDGDLALKNGKRSGKKIN